METWTWFEVSSERLKIGEVGIDPRPLVLTSQTTGVIQLIPPVLSSETLLHILLSFEYSGFRPSTAAVVIIGAPISVPTGPTDRRLPAHLSPKIVKKVFIVITNVFPVFLT